jgi:hypothetical protein
MIWENLLHAFTMEFISLTVRNSKVYITIEFGNALNIGLRQIYIDKWWQGGLGERVLN